MFLANLGFLNDLGIEKGVEISATNFTFSIILSFILSYLLSQIYKKNFNSFSNPNTIAHIFPILSIGTTIIIAVVKSSLALSLGLVGALSIVRFRTPIKEPEELSYIFLCIGIGLATGSDQPKIAIIGFILTVIFIYLNKKLTNKKFKEKNISLMINGIYPNEIEKVINLLTKNSYTINFRNLYTENDGNDLKVNISLSLIPKDFKDVNSIVNEITKVFPSCTLSIIDNNINY